MKSGKESIEVIPTARELQKGQRSPYWDNIKGILIFLVVFAHCLYGLTEKDLISAIVKGVYFFHMPAFVFVSGYFSKRGSAHSGKAYLRLVAAYGIITIPFIVRAMINGDALYLLRPYFSAWYLLAVMGWRLIAPCFEKVRGILPLCILFSLLVGFWPDAGGQKVLAVNKIVTFLPFFMAGYLLPENDVEVFRKKPSRYIVGMTAAVAGFAAGVFVAARLDVRMKHLLPGAYSSSGCHDLLIRICVFGVAFLAIVALCGLTPEKNIPFITKFGRHSMSIYLFHRLITIWFYEAAFIEALRVRWQLALALVLTACILLCFGSNYASRVVNWMTSNKTFIAVIYGLLMVVPLILKTVLAI